MDEVEELISALEHKAIDLTETEQNNEKEF